MKLQILSDLHNEFLRSGKASPDHHWQGFIADSNADVVVLAGDIDNGTLGFEWAVQESRRLGKPIIYVPGNHEYYHHEYFGVSQQMPVVCKGSDVHCLDCGVFVRDDVRIIGATLWTDYAVNPGVQTDQAMSMIEQRLPDHKVIKYKTSDATKTFMPLDALSIHRKELSWLQQQLERDFNGKTVVVTHHGPHPCCQHPDFPVGEITGAFYSDLTALIEKNNIDLWVYGHTHANLDEMVANTRIVSNQAGYPGENVQGFDEKFVVTV